MKPELYIHKCSTCVRAVCQDGYSDHYPNEEPDTFVGTPTFIRTGQGKESWQRVEYDALPQWAKEQVESS